SSAGTMRRIASRNAFIVDHPQAAAAMPITASYAARPAVVPTALASASTITTSTQAIAGVVESLPRGGRLERCAMSNSFRNCQERRLCDKRHRPSFGGVKRSLNLLKARTRGRFGADRARLEGGCLSQRHRFGGVEI